MYDYIVEGLSLEDIDNNYGLSSGTSSSRLSKYKITGKDVNWNGSYNSGKYRGKYGNDNPYVVKSQYPDFENDVVEVFIDKKVLKDFVKKRYDDETLEDYLERKYEINESILNGLGLGSALKRGGQKGRARVYKEEKGIGEYNLSKLSDENNDEKLNGTKINPMIFIGALMVGGVLVLAFNPSVKNFVMSKYIDIYSAKVENDNQKLLQKKEEAKVSTEDKPGIVEYNGLTYSCRSVDGVPYKQAIGMSKTETIVGNFINGNLSGNGFHRKDNTIEMGYFIDGVLNNGVYLYYEENVPYFVQVYNSARLDYKVTLKLDESGDWNGLSAYNLDDTLIAEYYNDSWYDINGNILNYDSENYPTNLSYFYFEDGKPCFSYDDFNFTKSGWLRIWNSDVHMVVDVMSDYLVYDTLFESEFIRTDGAKFENYDGGIKAQFLNDEIMYERTLQYK